MPDSKPKPQVIKVFKWMGKESLYFFIIIGLLAIITYLRIIIPLFQQHIVDHILGDKESKLPSFIYSFVNIDSAPIKEQLFICAFLLVVVTLVRCICIFLRRMASANFSERLVFRFRNKLYLKLLDVPFAFHKSHETGDLIQRATTDIETYRFFVCDQLVEIIRIVLTMGFSLLGLATLNPKLMLISLVSLPVIFFSSFIYFIKVKKYFEIEEENEATLTNAINENVSGIRVVKAFAREEFEIEKFDKLNDKLTESSFLVSKLMSLYWALTDFIIFAQFLVCSIVGIYLVTNNEMGLGSYIASLAFISNICWPLRQLGRIVGDFGKVTVSVGRLDEILSYESEYTNDGHDTDKIIGKIEYQNVTFKYSDSNVHQIDDLSFTIESGERVAIVGRTGSGKSTLMNLLVRLIDPNSGRILIDGKNINEFSKRYLRSQIGFIQQEPFLFSKTIEENIAITVQNLDEEKVVQAASIANIHRDVKAFESGYKTMVGEKGVTLSGGQKQRVAIARTLINQKPIIIFDDSLSAVDSETDKEIREELSKHFKSSTIFFITHRINTAMQADKIIILDAGKVQEIGTHESLLKTNEFYKELYDIQSSMDLKVGE